MYSSIKKSVFLKENDSFILNAGLNMFTNFILYIRLLPQSHTTFIFSMSVSFYNLNIKTQYEQFNMQ